MPTNYYDDGDSEDSMPVKDESPEKHEERQDNERTTLIPSSLCPGMDVGEEIVLKIVGVHEDEYEVAYAPEKGKEDQEESDEPSMSRASEMNEEGMRGRGMGRYMD